MSKKAIATFMKIDWAIVGRCISRCRERIEPHPEERLHGLVNIAVDETSFRTGHKYITVMINQDTCSVVWAREGHGKEVLMKFFDALTPERLKAIKTVSGAEPDGLTPALRSGYLMQPAAWTVST